tara:strand:- start:1018 stop:1476 length:459 start_codon:yes stop_codon:yes gene_type:complete
MSTTALAKRHANAGDYSNEPATVFEYCDVVAVAELIYRMAYQPHVDLKLTTVTIRDVFGMYQHTLEDERLHTQALKYGFGLGEGTQAEQLERVAIGCDDLVCKGWLERVNGESTFRASFWDDPESDQYEQFHVTYDLMMLMRRHFDDGAKLS